MVVIVVVIVVVIAIETMNHIEEERETSREYANITMNIVNG